MIDLAALRAQFRSLYGRTPRIFRAPGRVNLIGEHVDYNDGWVLPIAIDRGCYVLAAPREDSTLRIHSVQMNDSVEARIADSPSAPHHWSDYVRGAAWALLEAGKRIIGADLLISSEVPLGSGLSSSAALEVASGSALLALAGEEMERKALALTCQRAENEYVGMRCGIMDQFTSCFGRAGHALLIDCRTLAVQAVSLDDAQVRVVVANTMVKHALAASEYNRRRAECEEAVGRIRIIRPEVRALRDVSSLDLSALATSAWPDNVLRRARHITSEIERVQLAVSDLARGNYLHFGRLMAESHVSLDREFEVSSPELNTMVALARELPACLGARMTGGGFGGCTVNLVAASEAESFAAALAQRYEAAMGRKPEIFICRAADGAGEVA
jgi:galactokinase